MAVAKSLMIMSVGEKARTIAARELLYWTQRSNKSGRPKEAQTSGTEIPDRNLVATQCTQSCPHSITAVLAAQQDVFTVQSVVSL